MHALAAALVCALPAGAFSFGLGGGAAKSAARTIEKAVEVSSAAAAAAAGSGLPARLKWSVSINETYNYSSPALANDGTVYIASSHHFVYYNNYWNLNQRPPAAPYGLYAYLPDGTLKWKYADGTDAPARGSPVIGPDGTVYIVLERLGTSQAATSEELHAVDPATGARKWKITICNCYSQIGTLAPSVAPDGTIYVTSDGVAAYNPDSSLKWRVAGSASPTSVYFASPAIGHDGTVYAVFWTLAAGQVLRAFNPADGSTKWDSRDLGTYPISCAPSLSSGGTVYLGIHDQSSISGAGNGALLAFSTSTGAMFWAFPAVDFDVRSQPSVDGDGTIYFGTKGNSGYVYALNPNGTQKWRHATVNDVACQGCGTDVYNTPLIGRDGTLYVANELSVVYAFNPDGTILWKDAGLAAGGGFTESSADIAADGTLYIASAYGKFIAVRTASMGLSNAAQWARFHSDTTSSGAQP